MLDEKIMGTVEEMLPLLRKFPRGEYGLAVGGAHAKKIADHESDLDLYVFTDSVLSNSERTRITNDFNSDIRDVVSWGCDKTNGQS